MIPTIFLVFQIIIKVLRTDSENSIFLPCRHSSKYLFHCSLEQFSFINGLQICQHKFLHLIHDFVITVVSNPKHHVQNKIALTWMSVLGIGLPSFIGWMHLFKEFIEVWKLCFIHLGGKLRHSLIILLYLSLLGKCEIIIIVKHIVDELADVHCLIGWQTTR